jgi:hypothetical protein
MTTKELFNNVRFIYEKFEFEHYNIVNNLMIISNDNYYQLHFRENDDWFSAKIEINFSLYGITEYSLYYQMGDDYVETEGESLEKVPNELYVRIAPIIRHFKLKIIQHPD